MTLRRARPYWAGKVGGAVAEYSVIYSLRNVSGWTGDVIQVRRVSDSQDEWFGYSGGVGTEINTSDISTFLGASAGRVRQLKNTGSLGVSFDLSLSSGDGAEIYDGSSFHFLNGKLSMDFSLDSSAYSSGTTSENVTDNDNITSVVIQRQSSGNLEGVWSERDSSSITRRNSIYSDNRSNRLIYGYGPDGSLITMTADSTQTPSSNTILSYRKFSSDVFGFIDGTQQVDEINTASAIFPTSQGMDLGRQASGSIFFNGLFSEIIIDKSDPSSTRLTDLINDQKSFYGIT